MSLPSRPIPFPGTREEGTRDQLVADIQRSLRECPRPFLITGSFDAMSPTKLTEGLIFTAGQTRVIDHGAGVEIVTWLELPMSQTTSKPSLTPAHQAGIDPTKQVRVTATNAGSCHLLCFPRGGASL